MKKKDIDPNEQLDFAVSELQVAIEKVKQSRSQEIKMWQQRTYELQNQVQTQIHEFKIGLKNNQIVPDPSYKTQLYGLEDHLDYLHSCL